MGLSGRCCVPGEVRCCLQNQSISLKDASLDGVGICGQKLTSQASFCPQIPTPSRLASFSEMLWFCKQQRTSPGTQQLGFGSL